MKKNWSAGQMKLFSKFLGTRINSFSKSIKKRMSHRKTTKSVNANTYHMFPTNNPRDLFFQQQTESNVSFSQFKNFRFLCWLEGYQPVSEENLETELR